MSRRLISYTGGIGMAAIILCAFALLVIITVDPPSATDAKHEATKCIIRGHGEWHPVTYMEEHRQNPDGTFYPGDAFYYLFWWSDVSEPGECGMRPPILETQGLRLNHTAKVRGPANPETGQAPAAKWHDPKHKAFDPVVRLTESVQYFAAKKDGDACKTTYAKPGESWSVRWQKYLIYDKPSLVKTEGAGSTDTDAGKLTDLEIIKAKKRPPGATAVWEYWHQTGKGSGRGLPVCEGFARWSTPPPTVTDDTNDISDKPRPPDMQFYTGRGDGSHIFYSTAYAWRLIQDGRTPHAHNHVVDADNDTRAVFDARIAEVCGKLAPDSGCLYGTATIRPFQGRVCLYDEIERILGDRWLSNPDKDKDGTADTQEHEAAAAENATAAAAAEEEAWWPPPPLYLPPGIHISQYVAPTSDVCTSGSDEPLLRLVVKGNYWTPHHRVQAGIEYPIRGTMNITVDKSPPMQNTTLHAILTKPPLLHADGLYDAKNLDGTYYHNDPIHIRHEPSWKWADERYRHIDFETYRLHTTIPIDDTYDCTRAEQLRQAEATNRTSNGRCINMTATTSDNWHRQSIEYGNGDGRTVHVADISFGYGTYEFAYNMTAYNLGEPVSTNNGTDSTDATLVPYLPVYDVSYAYPALRDGQEYAFADRRGLVVRYEGSMGGQEYGRAAGDLILYPERRSYVNYWNELGLADTPFATDYYDEAHVLDEARSVRVIKHADSANPDNTIVVEHRAPAQSAMFVQDGYGAMLWEWDAMPFAFEQNKTTPYAEGATRENVTSYLHLWSADFAGKDTPLPESLLRYPETPFGKHITIRSVNQSGHTQYADQIELNVRPYLDADLTAEYVADYMADKLAWDTDNDTWIAKAILDDTHDMRQEYRGNGMIDARILRNSIYFEDHIIPQSDAVNQTYHQGDFTLGDFFLDLVGERPESVRLSAPMDVGFGALSPTELHITINGQLHVLRHKYYAFGGSETIEINVRQNETADVRRTMQRADPAVLGTNSSILDVRPPANFGLITTLMVNGTVIQQDCRTGCTISYQPHGPLNVTLHNAWGGTAHTMVNATVPVARAAPEEGFALNNDNDVWLTVASIMAVGITYLAYRRIMKISDSDANW